ncbi:MAG: N-acetylglucosamine-6-phosphate deacetylase [Clostridiales bacterium]|nr:N-acetylglucosamine-6-phosphate deacetylase [Clostridiales bacterium]
MSIRALKSKYVVDGYRTINDGIVIYADGKIQAVGSQKNVKIPEGAEVVDYGENIICPGLIDIHLHGCKGIAAMGSLENTKLLSDYVVGFGVTTIVPTGRSMDVVKYAYEMMEVQKKEGYTGAAVAGSHMEGPFYPPKNLPGRPDVDAGIIPPDIDKFNEAWEMSHHTVKILDLGVELPGAFELARHAKDLGILVACAHSKAGYDEMVEGMEHGITHATHLYNVMTGLHHRRPGITGAALSNDMISCELICDTYHVHPAAMEIAIRCKGVDNIAMVSDHSMGGLPDGEYTKAGGVAVVVKDGICRFKGSDPSQDNTMSGSCFLQNAGLRSVTKVLSRPLHEAVRMATISPAKMINIDSFTGSLEVGKDADIAVFDPDFNSLETIVKGTVVFKK